MKKPYTIILGCLAALTHFAHASEAVTVPSLEGGFTASVGTFYATPSTNSNPGQVHHAPSNLTDLHSNNNNPQFGTQGSIGYNFNNTGNGVEINNRNFR